MNITIAGIQERGCAVVIEYSASVGCSVATWANRALPPVIGARYEVEIDVADTLRLDDNTAKKAPCNASIAVDGDIVVLVGSVDSVDEDGMLYLRLARDCLVMVESSPGAFRIGDNLELRIPIEKVLVTASGKL